MISRPATELAALLGLDRSLQGDVLRVCTDSRAARAGDLFVGLRGPALNGGRFASAALAQGAVAAVLDAAHAVGDVRELVVADPQVALVTLAAANRDQAPARRIAITGSVGKTTFKDSLATLLKDLTPTVAAARSCNNLEGVAFTLLELSEATREAIIECGTSAPGEISELAALVQPDVAVLTAIGPAHLAGLRDEEAVLEEKWDLARALGPGGLLVVNADDARLATASTPAGVRRLDLGLVARPGVLTPTDRDEESFRDPESGVRVQHGLRREPQVRALWMAFRLGVALGHAPEALAAAARAVTPSPLRGEERQLGDLGLILDCYNANPLSMAAALEDLERRSGPRLAVVGEMLELGARSEAEHRALAARLAEGPFDEVLFVGPSAPFFREHGLAAFEDLDAARPTFRRLLAADHGHLLLKASRGVALERLLEEPA